MAVNQPREGRDRVEGGPATTYDAPTQQVRAVDDARDVDGNAWNRPQVPLLRERAHWGAIWAGALMLDHLGQRELHDRLLAAIERVVAGGKIRTPDLGGKATTEQMTKAITGEIS